MKCKILKDCSVSYWHTYPFSAPDEKRVGAPEIPTIIVKSLVKDTVYYNVKKYYENETMIGLSAGVHIIFNSLDEYQILE